MVLFTETIASFVVKILNFNKSCELNFCIYREEENGFVFGRYFNLFQRSFERDQKERLKIDSHRMALTRPTPQKATAKKKPSFHKKKTGAWKVIGSKS